MSFDRLPVVRQLLAHELLSLLEPVSYHQFALDKLFVAPEQFV
jgi:hypothetical protein